MKGDKKSGRDHGAKYPKHPGRLIPLGAGEKMGEGSGQIEQLKIWGIFDDFPLKIPNFSGAGLIPLFTKLVAPPVFPCDQRMAGLQRFSGGKLR